MSWSLCLIQTNQSQTICEFHLQIQHCSSNYASTVCQSSEKLKVTNINAYSANEISYDLVHLDETERRNQFLRNYPKLNLLRFKFYYLLTRL